MSYVVLLLDLFRWLVVVVDTSPSNSFERTLCHVLVCLRYSWVGGLGRTAESIHVSGCHCV